MVEGSEQIRPEPSAERVAGFASRSILRMLSDRGIPANEVVVTQAELKGSGERAVWVISVLRGREQASHSFPPELIDKVLTRGPSREWHEELRKLLERVGVALPA